MNSFDDQPNIQNAYTFMRYYQGVLINFQLIMKDMK